MTFPATIYTSPSAKRYCINSVNSATPSAHPWLLALLHAPSVRCNICVRRHSRPLFALQLSLFFPFCNCTRHQTSRGVCMWRKQGVHGIRGWSWRTDSEQGERAIGGGEWVGPHLELPGQLCLWREIVDHRRKSRSRSQIPQIPHPTSQHAGPGQVQANIQLPGGMITASARRC